MPNKKRQVGVFEKVSTAITQNPNASVDELLEICAAEPFKLSGLKKQTIWNAKYKMKHASQPAPRKTPVKVNASTPVTVNSSTVNPSTITSSDLRAVKGLAQKLGGVARLREVVEELEVLTT